jgi:hypothetical protein
MDFFLGYFYKPDSCSAERYLEVSLSAKTHEEARREAEDTWREVKLTRLRANGSMVAHPLLVAKEPL